ncbi:hypothetical protein SAMN04487966_10315 [Micrococcus terreus]|uniref:PE-PPE domain-containing protein n=1 Tax=Micrococcus terreus TaxID=574650 RepID=A0A1I7MIJ4_9MICC|nr:hypothetical protein SAMN04487966_10315 [Micrococcus terreus]
MLDGDAWTALGRPSSGYSGPVPARVQIQGGPTSIHANIIELERGTTVLGAQGELALGLSVRAGASGGLMSLAASHSSLASVVAGRTAQLAGGLAALGAEAAVMREAVHRSAAAYREAEARADAAMTKLLGLPALITAGTLMAAGQEVPQPVNSLVFNAMPELIALGLNGAVGGLGSAFTVVSSAHAVQYRDEGRTGPLSAAEVLYPALHWVGSKTGVVQLGPVRVAGRTGEARVDLDGSLVDLMELQKRGQDVGPGEIQVAQVTTQTPGAPERVFVVTVPGTQNWLGSEKEFTNPFDGGGIAEAAVFDSQHVAVGVDEALRQSGAQPGDSVVFTGYSQGAMHAMRVANDPRVNQRYRVEAVQTTGGPVEEMPLPDTVEALNLADGEDFVAAAGGRPIHWGPRRTTVTFHGGGPAEGEGMGAQHELDNYLRHTRDLDGSEQETALAPTLERFSLLTKGSAVVHTYQLKREPRPEPKHPLEQSKPRPATVRREVPGESAFRPSLVRDLDVPGRGRSAP